MGQITVSGILVGVVAAWFAFGFFAHINERNILSCDFYNFITLPFVIVCLPPVFLWTFATNKNYRADCIKNLKRQFSKKA